MARANDLGGRAGGRAAYTSQNMKRPPEKRIWPSTEAVKSICDAPDEVAVETGMRVAVEVEEVGAGEEEARGEPEGGGGRAAATKRLVAADDDARNVHGIIERDEEHEQHRHPQLPVLALGERADPTRGAPTA